MEDFLKTLLSSLDVPAAVLLVLLLVLGYVIKIAQSRKDFDFGNMLKDDAGKESAMRLGVFVSLAISSWLVVYDTIHNKSVDTNALLIYMAIWSGAKAAEKLIDAFASKWAK